MKVIEMKQQGLIGVNALRGAIKRVNDHPSNKLPNETLNEIIGWDQWDDWNDGDEWTDISHPGPEI